MKNQKLINRVLDQIKKDVNNSDMTAIEAMITFVPIKNLKAFLSEFDYIPSIDKHIEKFDMPQ
jgi:hypothetical protein